MKHTILAYSDFQKTKLEYTIEFDAVTNMGESYTNQVTLHTVEDGGTISDHSIKSKDKINIEGIVTDLSFNQGDAGLVMFLPDGSIQAQITESWSRKTKKMLKDINERILPCSVKSSYKEEGIEVIESEVWPCLIESLNLDSSAGQLDFIQPKITLVPVRLAKLEFTELTADQSNMELLKNQNPTNGGSSSANAKTGSTDDGKSTEDGKEVDLDLGTDVAKAKEATKGYFGKAADAANTGAKSLVNGAWTENMNTRQELNEWKNK